MGSVNQYTPQRLKSVGDTIPEVTEFQAAIDSGIGMTALDFFQESFSRLDALVFTFLVKVNGIAPIHRDRTGIAERILVHSYYPL